MSRSVLLLAETDAALRELMRRSLATPRGEVWESGTLSQLEQSLQQQSLRVPEAVLLVLGVRLAMGSAFSIRALARERSDRLLPPAHVVLTYEFGTLATIAAPNMTPCHVAGILEKPFDLQTLQSIASTCLNE